MWFTSRVVIHDDVYHRMYEFGALIVLGSAVLYIRPVDILSDLKNNGDMFGLSLAFSIAGVVGWGRSIEVYFKGVGQPAMKSAMRRDVLWFMPSVLCFFAATFIAGFESFGSHEESYTASYSAAGDDDHADEAEYGNSTSIEEEHRMLAAAEESSSYVVDKNDVPAYLLVAGSLLYIGSLALMVLMLPGGGMHKE